MNVCEVTPYLFICGCASVSASNIKRHHISTLICCARELGNRHRSYVTDFLFIPADDFDSFPIWSHFDQVVDKIQSVAVAGGRVLIYCQAGVSRSASMVLAYLMKYQQMTLIQAHQHLRARRPIIRPNNGFWRQLMELEKKLRGSNTVQFYSSPIGRMPDVYRDQIRNMIRL